MKQDISDESTVSDKRRKGKGIASGRFSSQGGRMEMEVPGYGEMLSFSLYI